MCGWAGGHVFCSALGQFERIAVETELRPPVQTQQTVRPAQRPPSRPRAGADHQPTGRLTLMPQRPKSRPHTMGGHVYKSQQCHDTALHADVQRGARMQHKCLKGAHATEASFCFACMLKHMQAACCNCRHAAFHQPQHTDWACVHTLRRQLLAVPGRPSVRQMRLSRLSGPT